MNWFDFYKHRDPARYLAYARRRYEPFLAIIQAYMQPNDILLEAGCGMGTITKALIERGVDARSCWLGGESVCCKGSDGSLSVPDAGSENPAISRRFEADLTRRPKAAMPSSYAYNRRALLTP